jgi:HAD superfamily hydrolase (TIGR01490 family)
MANASYAFFDVDETLIRTKSMFDFYRFFCGLKGADRDLEAFEIDFAEMQRLNWSREELNRAYYRYLAGTSPDELSRAGALWWAEASARPGIIIAESLALLRTLRDDGITPVFVSGSFEEVLDPIGRQLGVQRFLCAPMKIGLGGYYTGELGSPQTIGAGKARAVDAFLNAHGACVSQCWAVGDDLSDLPMLETVGRSVAVGTGTSLSRIARERGWLVLEGAAPPA